MERLYIITLLLLVVGIPVLFTTNSTSGAYTVWHHQSSLDGTIVDRNGQALPPGALFAYTPHGKYLGQGGVRINSRYQLNVRAMPPILLYYQSYHYLRKELFCTTLEDPTLRPQIITCEFDIRTLYPQHPIETVEKEDIFVIG